MITYISQIILALGLFFIALLCATMVRQTGLMITRLKQKDEKDNPKGLKVGDLSPIEILIDIEGNELLLKDTFLLFISFSCPMCQEILTTLDKLPKTLRPRLILMILDKGFFSVFSHDISNLKLDTFKLVEGYQYSSLFNINHAPTLIELDKKGKIAFRSPVHKIEDIQNQIK